MLFNDDRPLKARYINPTRIGMPEGATRRRFDETELEELTESVAKNGVIVPLLVKRHDWPSPYYTLISGARRLTAALRAGLSAVPIVEIRCESAEALRLSLLCDLHRSPLGSFELASAYEKLAQQQALDQKGLSNTLGVSAEDINTAFDALSLEEDEQRVCEAAGLDNKQIRKILSLERSERNRLFYGLLSDGRELAQRSKVLRERIGAQTSENHLRTIAFKDVRIFFNTIDRAVDVMKQAGVEASSERQDVNGCVEYRIRIPAADACTHQ